MATTATLRKAHLSAQKGRLMADLIRGKSTDEALRILTFSPKKSAAIIRKLLESAIANAENNDGADIDALKVEKIWVDEGPTYRRMQARAKGRGTRIEKRTSHITISVAEGK